MSSAGQYVFRVDLFKQAVVPALRDRKPFVSQDVLKKLKVTLKHLDLTTGDIDCVKGSARLVPMPAAVVQQSPDGGLFERMDDDGLEFHARGDDKSDDGMSDDEWSDGETTDDERNCPDTRFYQALKLHTIASTYKTVWHFPDQVKWRMRCHDPSYLQGLNKEGSICYEIQTVSEPFGVDGALDTSRPCVVGYQVEMTRPLEGQLLTSELNALIVLATKYDGYPAYSQCDEFVITVITGCDRQVRVAQSRVNMARKTFDGVTGSGKP
ncbi:hypothetical protein V2A60_005659 [Cordyceps javanica]